ncbi:MAG TPA: ATP-binding protein, partial [Pseudonocardiaceae bacterium]|nr:ATP-binding protein [Pseudonocardiaceae bacterium]
MVALLASAWLAVGAVLSAGTATRRLAVPLLVVAAALAVAAFGPAGTRGVAAGGVAAGIVWLLAGLPDGRLATAPRRWLVVLALVLGPAMGAWSALAGVVAVTAPASATGIALAAKRYPTVGLTGRRRILWVVWGLTFTGAVAASAGLASVVLNWPRAPGEVAVGALAAVPLGLLASVWPITSRWVDSVLDATVSLLAVAAVVAGAEGLAVLALGRWPVDGEREVLGLSIVAAVLVAAVQARFRLAVTDRVNRLIYGKVQSPAAALAAFPARMTRAVPLGELLLQLVEMLRSAWRLAAAEVWTSVGDRFELTASVPPKPRHTVSLSAEETTVVSRAGVSGGTWAALWLKDVVGDRDQERLRVAPLAHSGRLLGLLVCERQPERDPFTAADDALLVDLARQVALALRNAKLDSALQASLAELRTSNEELRRSRARLVATADAERRRLERDLHDGAGQHLMALEIKLRKAADAMTGKTADLLEELQADVRRTSTELRALAHGIYPPLLISDGLSEALPAAASRTGRPFTLDVAGLGRYPPEIEAAVYFCCLEAMQNAAKHAGPTATISLRADITGTTLWFEVRDDGTGFDPAGRRPADPASTGHGLDNMADRIGACGGTLVITSAPGVATTVRGDIPLEQLPSGVAT